jgi:hypothetical protein
MEQSRGVETGGGGGSRLSEMPPPLSTRVCGEFSGQGERVLRRRKREEEEEEEEEDWRESVGEPGCGICLEGGDYWAWAHGAPIFLSLYLYTTSRPLFSLISFFVSFIYSFLFSSFCSCLVLVLLGIRG